MKFQRLFSLGIGVCLVLVMSACSKPASTTSGATAPLSAVVTRGPQNQPIIKIEGKVAPGEGHLADQLLAETDGYVTATDRFLQMDLLRRFGRAKLGELFAGDAALTRDKLMIGVGLPLSVERTASRMQNVDPEAWSLLTSYAKGVNRYIAEIPEKHPEVLRQFQMFSRDPAFVIPEWDPRDTLAVATSMSFYLSSKLQQKVSLGIMSLIMRVFQRDDELTELFDFRPIEKEFIVGKQRNLAIDSSDHPKYREQNRHPAVLKLKDRLSSIEYQCKDYGFPMPECKRHAGVGSNNWTISKRYAGGDTTLLANDPHLVITFPATFIEMSGDSKSAGGTLRVRGVKPPGVPGVLIGHNDDIGWGMTNLGADVDQIYIEDMGDDTKTTYRWGTKYKGVETIKYPYRRRLPSGKLDTRMTLTLKVVKEHGPIFSEFIDELETKIKQVEAVGDSALGKHIALSYKWVGHQGTTEMSAILGVNRARNYQEFRNALDKFEVGTQNTIYADKFGNIGYYAHGLFPMRPYVSENKYLPYEFVFSPVAEGSREWTGWRKTMPERFQSDGYIVTANNDPFGHSAQKDLSNYTDYFGYDFTDGIRASRIKTLLEETKAKKGSLDVEDMRRIQNDQKDLLAIRVLEIVEKSGVQDKLTDQGKAVYAKLMEWKASGAWANANEVGPTYFYEWMPNLMTEWFRFGDVVDSPFSEMVTRMLTGAYETAAEQIQISSPAIKTLYNKMNDAIATGSGEPFEKTQKVLKASLDKAGIDLVTKKKETTPWGHVNRLVFEDLLGGLVPSIFTLNVARGGAFETVSPSFPGRGFGANFRMVLALKEGEPIQANIAIPGGNYGPFDADKVAAEIMLWRNGGMRDMVPMP